MINHPILVLFSVLFHHSQVPSPYALADMAHPRPIHAPFASQVLQSPTSSCPHFMVEFDAPSHHGFHSYAILMSIQLRRNFPALHPVVGPAEPQKMPARLFSSAFFLRLPSKVLFQVLARAWSKNVEKPGRSGGAMLSYAEMTILKRQWPVAWMENDGSGIKSGWK
jgi:hypothetical protein